MNLALDELKEQWRVEKAALELADAQNDIKDVSSKVTMLLERRLSVFLRYTREGKRIRLVFLLVLR